MAASLLRACLAVGLLSSRCLASDPWEWAGVYNFPTVAHYVWSASRNTQGQYADPSMKLIVVAASTADDAGLHGAEARATTLFNGAATTLQTGNHIEATDAAYNLVFDQRTWVTHFELHVDVPGAYAIFTEHMPTEFENGFHFLKSEDGADVETVVEEGGGHHGHGSPSPPPPAPCPWNEAWEWSGVFDLPASGYYTWNAARGADGSYADAGMKLVVVAAQNATAAGLADTAASAQALWGSTTAKTSGQVLQIGGAYSLTFDTHSWVSHFLVQAGASGAVAFYAQHLPTEFEKDFHYLKSSSGGDIEPAAQASVADCSGQAAATTPAPPEGGSWGAVLAGAFITCLPTLLGVLFVVPDMADKVKQVLEKASGAINAFASGVIFAAAVFLLLPEALHLAGSGHPEVVGAWTWGTCILLGWFTGFLIAGSSKVFGMWYSGADEVKRFGGDEEERKKEVLARSARIGTVGSVLLGDFFHNFSDGLVIGVAFKVCGGSFGWKVVGVTFAHELPQELADLVILVLDARVKWHWATLANFLCSLSTILGAIITYAADVGTNQEGLILAYGAGVYLYVALTELGVHLLNPSKSGMNAWQEVGLQFASFILGTVLLGLVLLGHEHCSGPAPVSADGSPAPAPSGGHHHH